MCPSFLSFDIESHDTAPSTLISQARLLHPFNRKKAGELFSLSRLFQLLPNVLPVVYPLKITSSETPDLIIYSGCKRVGVEITQFRPEQLARAENLCQTNNCGMFTTAFDFDSPKRSNNEIWSLMGEHQAGLADWTDTGSRVAIHTAVAKNIVENKTRKIVAKNEHKLDECWLVIEDRMNLGHTEASYIMSQLHEFLASRGTDGEFDYIAFIILNGVVEYRKDH